MKIKMASMFRGLIILIILAFPILAKAQFLYTANGATVTITGFTGGVGPYVTIPSTIDGLPVTSLGDEAFRFSNIGTVTIPASVTSIGAWCFANCSLFAVTMTNSLTSIGDYAFFFCTNLHTITVPASVTSIGFQAFGGCSSLAGITVDPLNSSYSDVQGVLFNKSQTTLIKYPRGKSGSNYAIPFGVTSIGSYGLADAHSLITVHIPKSVTSIAVGAFFISNPKTLASVFCQGNPPGVGQYAFRGLTATAYYLPGATGWGPTLGELPTKLWNPQVQTNDPSFGVQNNQFGFTITGTPNIPIVVEACTNLFSPAWITVQACSITNGSIYLSDPPWTNNPRRFYRIRSP
ncbi:MAG: cell surface protein [Pedosphaera sp.]|nr:cell surface protein [Pedosphaera sp.]